MTMFQGSLDLCGKGITTPGSLSHVYFQPAAESYMGNFTLQDNEYLTGSLTLAVSNLELTP